MNAPARLADLRGHGDVYPTGALEGCETALVLFAAGFYGRQDAVHIADAGLTATCVDTDRERLEWMAEVYPDDWEFVACDFEWYATGALGDRCWDVVSLDPPTSAFVRCEKLLPLWTTLARCAVVLGTGHAQTPRAPAEWLLRPPMHRSTFKGGVYWTVFEREEGA